MKNQITIILNIDTYAKNQDIYYKKYKCEKCGKFFNDHIHNKKHICSNCEQILEYQNKLILARKKYLNALDAYIELLNNQIKS